MGRTVGWAGPRWLRPRSPTSQTIKVCTNLNGEIFMILFVLVDGRVGLRKLSQRGPAQPTQER